MTRKRIKGTKYNRVTKQQKYIFLKLCITQKQSIHEAAFNAGIHYSTAKTILFFHKKQYKNYSTYIVNDPLASQASLASIQALWRQIPIDVDQQEHPILQQVQLIVNSKAKMLNQKALSKEMKDSTNDGKNSDQMEVKLQQVEQEFPIQVKQNQNFLREFQSEEKEIKKQSQVHANNDFFY